MIRTQAYRETVGRVEETSSTVANLLLGCWSVATGIQAVSMHARLLMTVSFGILHASSAPLTGTDSGVRQVAQGAPTTGSAPSCKNEGRKTMHADTRCASESPAIPRVCAVPREGE